MNEQTSLLDSRGLVEKSLDCIKFAYETAKHRGLGALYVCFSGGKDSNVLAELCRMAHELFGVEYELHYKITGIDPHDVVYFMRDHYNWINGETGQPCRERRECLVDLHWHQHEKSIFKLIEEKKIPPTRLVRYCCAELKEHGGADRMCLTGVRWAESVNRQSRRPFENKADRKAERMLFNDNDESRRGFESCEMKRALVCNPIIDWTTAQIWEFIRERELPYCKLYDEGFERIGCIGCPMAPKWEREREFARNPKLKSAYIRAFDRMLKNMDSATTWKTGQDVFDWWLNDDYERPDEGQIAFDYEVAQ